MKLLHGLLIGDGNVRNFSASWVTMNPCAKVHVWGERAAETILAALPPWVGAMYGRMTKLVQRVNLLRVAIIWCCGGIYLDLDMECIRPFGAWLDAELVLGNMHQTGVSPRLCNAILGARNPGHPFWLLYLREMAAQRLEISNDYEALETCGAGLLTRLVLECPATARFVQASEIFFPMGVTPQSITRHHAGAIPSWRSK